MGHSAWSSVFVIRGLVYSCIRGIGYWLFGYVVIGVTGISMALGAKCMECINRESVISILVISIFLAGALANCTLSRRDPLGDSYFS